MAIRSTKNRIATFNRLVQTGVIKSNEAAWQFIESLWLNFPSEISSAKALFEQLSPPIQKAVTEICQLPDEKFYLRNVIADPPGPKIAKVSIENRLQTPIITIELSDGTTETIQPDDPYRQTIENRRKMALPKPFSQ